MDGTQNYISCPLTFIKSHQRNPVFSLSLFQALVNLILACHLTFSVFTCCGHTVWAQPQMSWAKTNGPAVCFWVKYLLKNLFWKQEISTPHSVIQLVICVFVSPTSYAKNIIKHISTLKLLAEALRAFSLTLQVLIIHLFPTVENMLLESAVYKNSVIPFTFSEWFMIFF